MSIRVICSWCGFEWTKPGELPDGGVSHSICERCSEGMKNEDNARIVARLTAYLTHDKEDGR